MGSDYALKAEKWNVTADVDWTLVRDQLANYLREVIAHFNTERAAKQVYGIVVESGQNWAVGVYLNTEEGLLEGPLRFRSDSVGYEKHTDAQILKTLGRWHYQSWDFISYECECPAGICPNELHHELFERLYYQEFEAEPEEPEVPDVSQLFLEACAEAVAMLEQSRELKVLNKTQDFALRFYDADTCEWETDDIMDAARRKMGLG